MKNGGAGWTVSCVRLSTNLKVGLTSDKARSLLGGLGLTPEFVQAPWAPSTTRRDRWRGASVEFDLHHSLSMEVDGMCKPLRTGTNSTDRFSAARREPVLTCWKCCSALGPNRGIGASLGSTLPRRFHLLVKVAPNDACNELGRSQWISRRN